MRVQYIFRIIYFEGFIFLPMGKMWLSSIFIIIAVGDIITSYHFLYCRYLVICHPMKAQSVSSPDRTKKIIAAIWVFAIALSSVAASHFNGISTSRNEEIVTVKKAESLNTMCLSSIKCMNEIIWIMDNLTILYRSDPVYSNTVNLNFHLIQSFTTISASFLSFQC